MTIDDSQHSQALEKKDRKLLLAFAFVTISLASGLVYGWPALRRLLVEEGTALTEKEIGAIFTVGSWSTQGGRFLSGIARDSRFCGTRITTAACILAAAMGCTGLAFAGKDNQSALIISFFLVGIGSGAQLCLQPVAGLFDKTVQGTILSSMSGAFQISGLVFLLLAQITSDREISLGIFALCLFMLAILALKVLPRFHFSSKKVEVHLDEEEQDESNVKTKNKSLAIVSDDDCDELESSQKEETEEAVDIESEETKIISKETTDDDSSCEVGVMKLIMSAEYILLVLWFSVLLIPLQYYIATIGFQLERKGDDSGRYTSLFSVLYASSAIFAPLLGKFADKFGVGAGQAIATILSASSLLFLSMTSVSLRAHVVGMSFYGVGRMFFFGLFFTNVGKRFGFDHYGTLAGLGLLISSLFGNIQYPLIALAADGYEREVNIACGSVMLILGLPYCLWLSRRERRHAFVK
jgi:MFS family permease